MAAMSMDIKWETRLCTVQGETGYFHTWEQYSEPLAGSILKGGAPAGVFSKIYGIVEFADEVRRVDPIHIHFCDEKHATLCAINDHLKEAECESSN